MLDAHCKYGKIKVYEANTGVLRPLHPMFRKGAIPVEMKLAYDTPETIRELFTEYTRMLVENEPAFQTYLDLQDYAAELADLTKKYGLPHGRLYIAWCDDRPVGCALAALADVCFEFFITQILLSANTKNRKDAHLTTKKIHSKIRCKQILYEFRLGSRQT